MANAPGGSFIPKRSSGKVTPVRAGRRIYVFSYIAYVFFFGTLLSVVGIYFLEAQAKKQLDEHVVLLSEARQKFSQNQLDSVRTLDAKLQYSKKILNEHVATSRIFDELEPVIVKSVRLDNFSYTRQPTGGATLSLGGFTDSFDVLLFQRDAIKQSDFLAAADFTQVKYGSESNSLEGADRGRASAQSSSNVGRTSVTFTFEDETVADHIGYEPRSGALPATEETGTDPATEGTDTTDTTGSAGATDGTPQ